MFSRSSSTAAWAARYIEKYQLALVQIPLGHKAPLHQGWSKPGGYITDADEAIREWPATHGIGAVLAPSGLCSLDIDSPEHAEPVLASLGIDLQAMRAVTPTIQGNPARYRLMFKAPPGLSRKTLVWPANGGKPITLFELRAGDVQDVLPPTVHPETGKPYVWLVPPNSEFPLLPETVLELWQHWDSYRKELESMCPWGRGFHPETAPRDNGARPNVIAAFNDAHPIEGLLEAHGYKQKGGHRWMAPTSTSGLAGAVVLDNRVYSHHASDPLADGHSHDAFDVFRILDHNGDTKAAVKAAAEVLGMGEQPRPEPGNGVSRPEWPEPMPLLAKVTAEPYPLDALPDTIRAAVEEVLGFIKAPLPLVALSSLSALSIAIQGHVDVKRAEKLAGPTGLFSLTIAESGERKSTCDVFFTKAIRDYEEAQAEAAKPVLKDHKATIEAWEAKHAGIKDKIRQLAKENKPTSDMEAALREMGHDKPDPPRVPRLLYADATPEALAYGLAKHWPSGGVVSAEAGSILGAHAMGKDSVMRNLALLNVLWDGGSLTIDRKTSESFTVRGARLTIALQVQEATLREFLTRSGALARGTGFLARFLVAWPESTQGFRPFTEAPANWPALAAFNQRITAILAQPVPIDEDGALSPPILPLTTEAKEAWVAFHDAIEGELRNGGELYDVRDVASKTADNAVRLAALFQVFDGAGGTVGVEALESASRIVAWHLNESRRFFGELAMPVELVNAVRLDDWLIEHCRRERAPAVPKNHIRQHGPGSLRSKSELDATLAELVAQGRAQLFKSDKRVMVQVNPALLASAS